MMDSSDIDQAWYEHAGEGQAAHQYLSFVLGPEAYGVDILGVEEIKSDQQLTRIPQTPGWVKGILNLRGAIVPVVDLRQRFSIPPGPVGRAEVIIVLIVRSEEGTRRVGAIVDDVTDVVALADDQIREAPDLGSAISTEFIKGIATLEETVILVLDVDRLFSMEELSSMDEVRDLAQEGDDGGAAG